MRQSRIKLIDNWRQAPRFYCVHALLISVVLGVLVTALSLANLHWMPDWVIGVLTIGISISAIVGRLVKQDPADAKRIADLTHEGTDE